MEQDRQQDFRMKEHMLTLARYNTWANQRFCDFFSSRDPFILRVETPGSFPSIRELLLHIWDAEIIWADRLRGVSRTAFPSVSFNGPDEKILTSIPEQSSELAEYLNGLDESQLIENVAYTNTKGKEYSHSRLEILQHLFTHSAYHRGQLVIYSHALNIPNPPSTDLIKYLR